MPSWPGRKEPPVSTAVEEFVVYGESAAARLDLPWGRKAVCVQLVGVNAIFQVAGEKPVGVQDAYTFSGGKAHADWDNHRQRTAVDLSEVLITKANTAVYVVDVLEARIYDDGGIQIRIGTWQCEGSMAYREMAYHGTYLVQWAA